MTRPERFLAKHVRGLDPRMDTGSREKNASIKIIESASDSIRSGKALEHVSFRRNQQPVMPGFMPGIHVFGISAKKTWMGGTIGERSDAVFYGQATPFFERLCPAMTDQFVSVKTQTAPRPMRSPKRLGFNSASQPVSFGPGSNFARWSNSNPPTSRLTSSGSVPSLSSFRLKEWALSRLPSFFSIAD